MEINKDGSMVGNTFSGDKFKGEYPTPKIGSESFFSYRERVNLLRDKGFRLGDLSWSHYEMYCKGSGQYDGVDSYEIIN